MDLNSPAQKLLVCIYEKSTTFLGLLFDSKLTFLPHIKMLQNKCIKALNISKFVSSTDWGADSTVLLNLYRSLIRSELDYECVVYCLLYISACINTRLADNCQYTVISCLLREQSTLFTRGAGDDLRTVAGGRRQQFPSHLQHRGTIVLTVP
jgi:hypothetical protein